MALTYEFGSVETLITPQEIVDFAPVDPASYGEQRIPFIAVREEKLFIKCMGMAMYKVLMADKVKYAMTAGTGITVYTNFQAGNYSSGAVVLYKNRLYKAKANTTGQLPTDEGFWALAPRFSTVEHNYLWERYLRTILAFMISNDSLFYRIVSDTPMGVVQKYEGDKSKALDVKSAGRLKMEYVKDIDDMLHAMDVFIRENPEAFPDYAPLEDACVNCAPKKRHYGFNTNKRRATT